ncbi:alpha/beta fold hydrolase [Salinirussus salinus]|jgi:dienelactone hydrolase|uniref:alpha/beta fold hydrolase n=1 Tax=Salinirussus salinus TaxID=1198300 RepID=UPI0019160D08|nr:alpha/beta fold hydrolase [Salinirussus salinus]
MNRSRLRSQGKRLVVWLVAAGVVALAVALVYFGTPLRGTEAGIAAAEANPDVTVTAEGETYVLEPAGGNATAGLVFYPGGRVHPDAYVASLAPLAADANVTVVVPKMPLNLAVLDGDAASRYVTRSDMEVGDVDTWYVGGHSLGGVMACRYARANPDRVDGVVLFASYCDRDISGTGLEALSVTGSADTVLNRGAYRAALGNLPADATTRTLPLNHSQFGGYRGQAGDEPSGLSYAAAHRRLAEVVVPWLGARP